MTYPVNDASAASEDVFEIDLHSNWNGAYYHRTAMLSGNPLGQILEERAADLGINLKDDKILFENKRTHESTLDSNMTVEGHGLREGDVLDFVLCCGGVA